MTHHAGVLQGL